MRGLKVRVSRANSPRVSKGRHKGYAAKQNSQHSKQIRKHLLRVPK